ncbi:hypothetical protein BGX38DRAFT_1228814 [Terfezia claveryi]|nr:hypothetical protein BGX38DRAFT_1228814 [Terfezia claveryi]
MLFTLATLSLLSLSLPIASAHFSITYPPDRGEAGSNEVDAPCGGLSTSSTRTPWPISGGRVEFEAGHDEANTEVLLYVGDNPTSNNDFNIVLAPLFNQIGLGTFCWNQLSVPNGTAGVKEGAKATIQIRQFGHDGGWLYNCADISFTANPPALTSNCANDSGISTEPILNNDNGSTGNSGSGASGLTATFGGLLGAVVVAAVVGML